MYRLIIIGIIVICSVLLMLLPDVFTGNTYPPCLNQPLSNISSIELLDTHNNDFTVLYTLSESEIPSFCEQLMSLEFGRVHSTPSPVPGILAVRITYDDGNADIIGNLINEYYDSAGDSLPTKMYYLHDVNDFVMLFSQYVDESLLPKIK